MSSHHEQTQNRTVKADSAYFVLSYSSHRMFICVNICGTTQKVIIPTHWIMNFSLAKMCNVGLKRHIKYIIYYSKNIKDEPRFHGRLSPQSACPNTAGLFVAQIIRFFGELSLFSRIVEFFSANIDFSFDDFRYEKRGRPIFTRLFSGLASQCSYSIQRIARCRRNCGTEY